MKVLFVAAEAYPLVKVGGLADVSASLPRALTSLGHDVRVIIPEYGCMNYLPSQVRSVVASFAVNTAVGPKSASLKATSISGGVTAYMVNNREYFGDNGVYGENELDRFLFFSEAVFQILPQLRWQPDVVHCNDWHSALTVALLKKAGRPQPTVFTIHNLAYQGWFDNGFVESHGLANYVAANPDDPLRVPLNFMAQGILRADVVTTVSETYAREILTTEYGAGLDGLLAYRRNSVFGIINGIDYEEYDPQTDSLISSNYGVATVHRKGSIKMILQKRLGLAVGEDIPLIGMVQRLDDQKGFDILERAMLPIIDNSDVQIAILGRGREQYEEMLSRVAAQHPNRVSVSVAFDEALSRNIYAGSDMFLMPSRFEPCGLGQLIAMRYGSLPVVRLTGGLADTVPELSADLATGNGFTFRDYTAEALTDAVVRAAKAFRDRSRWDQVVRRVMGLDFSWGRSARKYESVYEIARGTKGIAQK